MQIGAERIIRKNEEGFEELFHNLQDNKRPYGFGSEVQYLAHLISSSIEEIKQKSDDAFEEFFQHMEENSTPKPNLSSSPLKQILWKQQDHLEEFLEKIQEMEIKQDPKQLQSQRVFYESRKKEFDDFQQRVKKEQKNQKTLLVSENQDLNQPLLQPLDYQPFVIHQESKNIQKKQIIQSKQNEQKLKEKEEQEKNIQEEKRVESREKEQQKDKRQMKISQTIDDRHAFNEISTVQQEEKKKANEFRIVKRKQNSSDRHKIYKLNKSLTRKRRMIQAKDAENKMIANIQFLQYMRTPSDMIQQQKKHEWKQESGVKKEILGSLKVDRKKVEEMGHSINSSQRLHSNEGNVMFGQESYSFLPQLKKQRKKGDIFKPVVYSIYSIGQKSNEVFYNVQK